MCVPGTHGNGTSRGAPESPQTAALAPQMGQHYRRIPNDFISCTQRDHLPVDFCIGVFSSFYMCGHLVVVLQNVWKQVCGGAHFDNGVLRTASASPASVPIPVFPGSL